MARTRRRKRLGWRKRFLRGLGRTGNARWAAAAAGVDHSTAYHHRQRNPAFDRAWARARKIGEARGEAEDEALLGAGGEEMVVRRSKHCGTQRVRAAKGRWSASKRRLFLGRLEATGNVRAGARAAAISTTALYRRKRGDPGFAADWDATEARAKASLHSYVVAAGIASFDRRIGDSEDGADLPRVTVSEAIAILRLKGPGESARPVRTPPGLRYGPRLPTIEEVRASILRRLDEIEAHERRKKGGETPLLRDGDQGDS